MPKGTVFTTIHGDGAHNMAFTSAIGQLIISWANNESVFLAILQSLICNPNQFTAQSIWTSHKSTRARLNLVKSLANEVLEDSKLIEAVNQACKEFHSATKTRNFFCHGMYSYSDDLKLIGVTSWNDDGGKLKQDRRDLDANAINSINDATQRLAGLNLSLWELVELIDQNTGLERESYPHKQSQRD